MANAQRKVAASNVVNFDGASARKLGRSVAERDANNAKEADALHKMFTAAVAKKDTKTANGIRRNFMIGYVGKIVNVDTTEAEAILKEGRGKDAKPANAKAIMAASQAFKHTVDRTGSKAIGKKRAGAKGGNKYGVKVTKAELTDKVRKLVDSLFEQFKGKTVEDQHRKVKTAIDMILAEEAAAAKAAEAQDE